MSVVSNTGPLIALAKIDRLALLQQLFGEVFIPPVVHRELLGKAGAEANRLDQALATFVHVHVAPIAGQRRKLLLRPRRWTLASAMQSFCPIKWAMR